MTKREAVKGLDRLKTVIRKESNMQIALDMAIEALEREQQRQEDIYECQYCFGEVHKNYTYCPFCGKRIEALEQEETLQNLTKPNKSDLISRQAAIEAVEKAVFKNVAKSAIESLPSTDRSKGYWIKEENPNLGVCLKKVYVCSNCGSAVGCQYFVRRSFCPNCGADMRSKEQ